jgi:MOSC domain-containing protein YiiM
MRTTARIKNLFAGTPEHRWQGKAPSAIAKTAAGGPVLVTAGGMSGDEQADRTAHGGPDKALNLYPSEHYRHWREVFPDKAQAYRPGGFGENVALEGLTEADLCVGDILAAGSVRLQVSHGRQPCWKLNLHTGNPEQAAALQKTARTGWYVRVLEEGTLKSGDTLEIVGRPCPDWNLRDVILARFDPHLDPATAQALANLEELAPPWRAAFAKKTDPGYTEDLTQNLK